MEEAEDLMNHGLEAASAGQRANAVVCYEEAGEMFFRAFAFERASEAFRLASTYSSDETWAVHNDRLSKWTHDLARVKPDEPMNMTPVYLALSVTRAFRELQSYWKDGVFARWKEERTHEKRVRISSAILRFIESGGSHTTLIPVYMVFGTAEFDVGNFEEACELFMKVVQHDPRGDHHWVASYRAALCLMFNQEWQMALDVLGGVDGPLKSSSVRARKCLISFCNALRSSPENVKDTAAEVLQCRIFTPRERALIRSLAGYPAEE